MTIKTIADRIAAAARGGGELEAGRGGGAEKAASRAIGAYLRAQFPASAGYTVDHKAGYYYASGFITRGGRTVYYNSGDYRLSEGYGARAFMYRAARDNNDYTGGANRTASLESLADALRAALADVI